MNTISVQIAPRVGPVYPFGARLVAALYLGIVRLLAGLLRPAPPRRLGPVEEAQAVRELALQYQSVDPRFAADLCAAADRHERLHAES